ncbi:MAG: hypothetical protein HFH35_08355 [Eubacterium sp.]|nr:hypothetical protein [Eubacterium sp.]
MKKINRKNAAEWCFVGLVLFLLAGSGIFISVMPDQTYSAQERRMLAECPKLTKKNLISGSFQRDFEKYLSEQFPGRMKMVSLQTKLSRLLGIKDANGVYFGSDGYLLEQYAERDFDWKLAEKNCKRTARFLKKYPNAKVLFVPVKSSVMSNYLPPFAQITGEARFFSLVEQQIPKRQRIETAKLLSAHQKEYIYYRTDHHWTTLGAYYAYQQWAQEMGFPPLLPEQFRVEEVSSSFLGTTYAKVRTGGRPDTISLYESKNGPAFALDYNMGEFASDSFYDRSKLAGDDPYSVFFGGNQALVDIRSKEKKEDTNGKTLLIIKDSFGNCFAPFAANHYARTIVADLRYMNIPVSRLLRVYPADDILILYNSVQFMEDTNLGKLK